MQGYFKAVDGLKHMLTRVITGIVLIIKGENVL